MVDPKKRWWHMSSEYINVIFLLLYMYKTSTSYSNLFVMHHCLGKRWNRFSGTTRSWQCGWRILGTHRRRRLILRIHYIWITLGCCPNIHSRKCKQTILIYNTIYHNPLSIKMYRIYWNQYNFNTKIMK